MSHHRFNRPSPPKRRLPKAPIGKHIPLIACHQHDRVMGLSGDTEAEVEFTSITAAGRLAVIYWTPSGASYREMDPALQVKLVRREAAVS
jgi:hypothetical protein